MRPPARTKRQQAKECWNRSKHQMGPKGYDERMRWMEKMDETHFQVQCPGCGLWAIWTKR